MSAANDFYNHLEILNKLIVQLKKIVFRRQLIGFKFIIGHLEQNDFFNENDHLKEDGAHDNSKEVKEKVILI